MIGTLKCCRYRWTRRIFTSPPEWPTNGIPVGASTNTGKNSTKNNYRLYWHPKKSEAMMHNRLFTIFLYREAYQLRTAIASISVRSVFKMETPSSRLLNWTSLIKLSDKQRYVFVCVNRKSLPASAWNWGES